MATGENEQGLRKIFDFLRLLSIIVLLLHFYQLWFYIQNQPIEGNKIFVRIFVAIFSIPVFQNIWYPKVLSLILLMICLVADKKAKNVNYQIEMLMALLILSFILYFGAVLVIQQSTIAVFSYILITAVGYLGLMYSSIQLMKIAKDKFLKDIFNKENETFPQEERKLENEYSINLPSQYRYSKRNHRSWINIINPFRGTLVLGTPGAGKSYFIIRHIITQHIEKGFSMFLYDFKYDDLSKIAFNSLLKSKKTNQSKFYIINFEDLSRTHRCNPLDPNNLNEISDSIEASRTIMLGLNREWIKKQGDFFVESSINFLTAIIWYLKKYNNGSYCTLPHAIELMQLDYKILFPLLIKQEDIEVLISPFVSAWKNEAYDQLEGQIASTKISLARLASPSLYYVLTGDDFTLDLNNNEEPKIICMGNNPQKQQVYGAVLSLYVSRMLKLINQKGKIKSSLIFDEFPTIYVNNIDTLLATARSNKVATTMAIQDFSQLKKDYGREQADVILNIVGNVISGQVSGDSAKFLAERFGKINQIKQSTTLSKNDRTISDSTNLDYAIPASKIASLSSGEFVGLVSDEPNTKIELKLFHNEILNNHKKIADEESRYKPIPIIREVNIELVNRHFYQVKQDIKEIVALELSSYHSESRLNSDLEELKI
jgi:hypothetical protein